MNDDRDPQLPLEEIHARQIHEEKAETDEPDVIGVPVVTVVASVSGSVLGTLTLAIVVTAAVICHIKATAHEKLESGLANLLIGAVAEAGSARKTKTSKNAVLPEEMAGPSILVSQMDSDGSGATDFEEFTRWAEQHGLEERQVKLLWKDLNKNKDSVISNKEWTKFIQTRPNLQWLVTRLKSVVNRDV